MTNIEEFRAGTDPVNASSTLALDFVVDGSGMVLLKFDAALNKTYSILSADALTGTVWSRVNDIGAGPQREISLPLGGTSSLGMTRFYRFVSPMQP